MKNGSLSRARKLSGLLLSAALMAANYTGPVSAIRGLSGDAYVRAGEAYQLPDAADGMFHIAPGDAAAEVSLFSVDTLHEPDKVTISLFGFIPIKSVSVHVREQVELVPGGGSIGVTLHTRGALVVGISVVNQTNGDGVSPASAAGIQAGDLIEEANGIEIRDADHLREICNESQDEVNLTILRANKRFTTVIRPALDAADGKYRMGMWVRDSTAGVGTLSFYDPETGWFGALGHAITDIDTRESLTVREGEIVESKIVDIVQGAKGEPGELRGTFTKDSTPLGSIEKNCQYGIYGRMYQPYENPLYEDSVAMAYPEEARLGDAEILTTLSNGGMRAYACSIIKINPQESPAQKGMVLEITDPELLDATGGIVQGMSGSPIIQDGKMIGVVTHVFINDPTKGYCMYALWMRQQVTP